MILFYILIAIMPLAKHPIWSHFVGDLTLTKYVGGVCLGYAIIHLCARPSFPAPARSGVAKSLLLFYAMAMYSYATVGLPRGFEVSPILSYTSFLLLFIITVSVVDSVERFRTTLFVAIGAVAFASLYVVREWQVYRNVYSDFRPGWITGDANYFTLSALLCLPLMLYLLCVDRPRWEKIFVFGSALVTILATTLAASRGGFLGLVTALTFLIFKSGQRFRKLALVGMLVAPLVLLSPLSPLKRLMNPDRSDEVAAQDRIVVWKAGLSMIQQHPWKGIGVGNFKPLVLQYEVGRPRVSSLAHNTYIEVAAEMGLPGLAVFLSIFVFAYRSLGRAQREAADFAPALSQYALGLQAGLIGSMVGIFFLSAEAQKLLWLVVFLSPCLEDLVWQAKEESSLEESGHEELTDAPDHSAPKALPGEAAQWA